MVVVLSTCCLRSLLFELRKPFLKLSAVWITSLRSHFATLSCTKQETSHQNLVVQSWQTLLRMKIFFVINLNKLKWRWINSSNWKYSLKESKLLLSSDRLFTLSFLNLKSQILNLLNSLPFSRLHILYIPNRVYRNIKTVCRFHRFFRFYFSFFFFDWI